MVLGCSRDVKGWSKSLGPLGACLSVHLTSQRSQLCSECAHSEMPNLLGTDLMKSPATHVDVPSRYSLSAPILNSAGTGSYGGEFNA